MVSTLTIETPRSTPSTPRIARAGHGVPFVKAKAVTKPISPKFSTTTRLQNRRQPKMAEITKTAQQQEADTVKQWFFATFDDKVKLNPYIKSQYDPLHPILSFEEFQQLVLVENLIHPDTCDKVKQGVLDENNHVQMPILRQFFRVHKGMFELKDNKVILVNKPGADKMNAKTKNTPVLFEL
jgi:hypothetical protein